jgi:hypothetical protein
MSQAALDTIKELNRAYRALTGTDAYLYTSQPDRSMVYTFATAARPFTNSGAALAHMQDALNKAQAGWTHDEITYGRSNGTVNPYPNAPRVNRGAW